MTICSRGPTSTRMYPQSCAVELRIAGVDPERRRIEREQLVGGAEDRSIRARAGIRRRTSGPSCLLPRPNRTPCPPTRPTISSRRDRSARAARGSAPRSGRARPAARRRTASTPSRVPLSPSAAITRGGRAAGTDQIQAAGLEVGGDGAAERLQLGAGVRPRAGLGRQHEPRQVWDPGAAVEDARRRDPRARPARPRRRCRRRAGVAARHRRVRNASPARAAASGLCAKTPECIFTPAGIPSTGSSVPTAS